MSASNLISQHHRKEGHKAKKILEAYKNPYEDRQNAVSQEQRNQKQFEIIKGDNLLKRATTKLEVEYKEDQKLIGIENSKNIKFADQNDNLSNFMGEQGKKHELKKGQQQNRTPKAIEKYQGMAQQIRSGSSPLNQKGISPQSFYKQVGKALSPANFKNGFQFNQASAAINKEAGSLDNQQNYSSNNYSTKDNTRITIINANNQSVVSTIYNVNNAYNSNLTANDSKLQDDLSKNAQTKPPLIPSLKAKIYQTSIGGHQTSKSGNRTNLLTGATGLTNDEKLMIHHEGQYSRTGAISILNVPSMSGAPLFTCQTGADVEDYISSRDIQSFVEFRRKEEVMTSNFYSAQNPYMFLNHSQLINCQNNRENLMKRMIFSNIEEVDRCISERNALSMKQKVSYSEWVNEMQTKSQKNLIKFDS